MQQLHDQYPNLHAIVVGGADPKKAAYLQEMQDNIQAKNLTERITFVGHRSDIREWLAFSDVVLSLSSQAELIFNNLIDSNCICDFICTWELI